MEALFFACGARWPQLKRHPLGCADEGVALHDLRQSWFVSVRFWNAGAPSRCLGGVFQTVRPGQGGAADMRVWAQANTRMKLSARAHPLVCVRLGRRNLCALR
jgi:hypothetical protein